MRDIFLNWKRAAVAIGCAVVLAFSFHGSVQDAQARDGQRGYKSSGGHKAGRGNRSGRNYRSGKGFRNSGSGNRQYSRKYKSYRGTSGRSFRRHGHYGLSTRSRYNSFARQSGQFQGPNDNAELIDAIRGSGGNTVGNINAYEGEDLSSSGLREQASIGVIRAPAKILSVSNDLKVLGEKRAARREALFDEATDLPNIRFYRPNEAYDRRFPSVVYLRSR